MKNKRKWNRKAAILAAAVLTSTCFFAGNYNSSYAADGKVIGGPTTGGFANKASGADSSVSGGASNMASEVFSSVSGGYSNTASEGWASVSGGDGNTASGRSASVSGGLSNTAFGMDSSAIGGQDNTAYGNASLSLGGIDSIVQGKLSVGMAGGSTGKDAFGSVAIGYGSATHASYNVAIGFESVATESDTISFGHKAGDTIYSIQWPEAKDSDGNPIKDFGGNVVYDHTQAPTIIEQKYITDFYSRLVKVADGEDAHDVATVGQLNKKLDADASNVDLDAWAKKLGTGKIESGNTGLVTGGTVYTEVRPASGTYVNSTSTTAANLTSLDTQVSKLNTNITQLQDSDNLNVKYTNANKKQVDLGAANLTTTGSGRFNSILVDGKTYISNTGINANNKVISGVSAGSADTDAVNVKQMNDAIANISSTGFSGNMNGKKITNLADGTDAADAVNKGQMDKADADTLSLAETYTKTAVNTAKDEAINASKDYTNKTVKTAFDQSKNYTDEKVSNINNSIKNLQESDGLNVKYTDSTKKNVDLNNAKIQNLGSGNIKDGSTDAVNGGDVYKYVKDHANGGVEVDDKGNSVVNKNFIVNGDTTIKGDTNLQNTTVNKKLTVAGDTDLQNTTVNKKLTVAGDTDLQNTTVNKNLTVSGDTDLQNTTVNKKLTVSGDTDLQNTTVNQKLTVSGDTDLQNTTVNKKLTVSGDTDLQNTTVNKNLTVNGYTTLGQTTINKQLAVQGNTYISQNLAVGGNATVAHNLVVGNTIAAKQVVADDAIIGGHSVIDEFNRQREDTDRVGAGAAALAALQYLPYEDGSKLVGGAGYGHYRGKNAGAVGLRYYPNRDVAFSMASTVGNGDTMLNAGVSFRIGSGTGSVHSIPDTNKVLKETQALNKALAERLDKVEKELKQSNDINEELMKRLAALEAKMK